MTHPYPYHVFICGQQKLEDKLYCRDQRSDDVFHELQRRLEQEALGERVELTSCGCLGLCRRGPVVVVYPEGTWYVGVQVDDVAEIVESHFKRGQPVDRLILTNADRLREEMQRERERARVQAVAHNEAGVLPERLRHLAGDFQASRAFLTAVELDLFTCVGDGTTASEVADKVGSSARATEMLLNALVAIGLLQKDEDIYRNGSDTGRFLRRGLPDDARAAVMNRVHMWDTWSTLTDCMREGSPTVATNSGPSATQAYIAATHRIANLAAPAMVASLDLPEVKKVLDVGGGSGAYTVAFLRAFPDATAVLMDLPPVLRVATRYIREADMEQRIQLKAGDFMVDPLGSGFDLVLLSYVLHLNPPEANKRLLSKAFAALAPGGRVVINDYVLNADKTLPRSAALYALNMLVSTQGGAVFSFEEISNWLCEAGFASVTKVQLLGPTDVVTAQKQGEPQDG